MSDWQPISTAPKDGTIVIVAWDSEDDPSPDVERLWNVEGAMWVDGFDGAPDEPGFPAHWMTWFGDEIEPTHWMPLPEPPA